MMFRSLSAMILSFVLGAALIVPAWADCVDDCSSAIYCDGQMYASGECSDRLNECYRLQCNRPMRLYGAIAYGAKSTANGYAFDKGTLGDANRTALSNCKQHGNDCKIVASFSNSCVAVAAVESEEWFESGQGDTRDQAQDEAMSACKAKGGGKCEIEVWTCALP